MNKALTQEIINHIFSGFSILKSSSFDNEKFRTLKSKEYILPEKISFENTEGVLLKNSVWGIQFNIEDSSLKIILADCSLDKQVLEYAMLVKIKDVPAYGLYSAYSLNNQEVDSTPMISVSVDDLNWMQCNTYLQATFLAGMENAKDMTYAPSSCSDYKKEYNLLLSFIKYHDTVYGDDD